MKKTYTKPELFYENFTLIAPIATCAYSLGTSADVASCGALDNDEDSLTYGMIIFNGDMCEVDSYAYGYVPGQSEAFITNS